jgi:hypothetical protein
MISKEMLELLFRPASIQRWNDHIRPHTGSANWNAGAQDVFLISWPTEGTGGHDR